MSEQQQVPRPPEETVVPVPELQPATPDLTKEVAPEDDLDIDISDLVEASKGLAKNFKQRGGE